MNDGSDAQQVSPAQPSLRTQQSAQPLSDSRASPIESYHPLAEPLMDVVTHGSKWSRANTIATLEMAVFALFVSVMARGTTLTAEQIQAVISDASGLVGTAVAPAAAVKGIVEFLRSDR